MMTLKKSSSENSQPKYERISFILVLIKIDFRLGTGSAGKKFQSALLAV
jgi:hypothetical protein